jgi:hypothetical protein
VGCQPHPDTVTMASDGLYTHLQVTHALQCASRVEVGWGSRGGWLTLTVTPLPQGEHRGTKLTQLLVAELVDNALTAGATRVDVHVDIRHDRPLLLVAVGLAGGMDEAHLVMCITHTGTRALPTEVREDRLQEIP